MDGEGPDEAMAARTSPGKLDTAATAAFGPGEVWAAIAKHRWEKLSILLLVHFRFSSQRGQRLSVRAGHKSGRAKGAAKGSCGETVVQKGVFGESVSSLPPYGLLLKQLKGPENLKGAEKKRTLQKHPFGQPFLRTTPSPLLWRAPKKTTKQTFCSRKWVVWDHVSDPPNPPDKVYVGPVFAFFAQEKRHINFCLGAKNRVVWVGGKVYVLFLFPIGVFLTRKWSGLLVALKKFLPILSIVHFFPKVCRGSARIKALLFWWFSMSFLSKEKKIRVFLLFSSTKEESVNFLNSCWNLVTLNLRSIKSTPDPDTFEKYRDTPPISIAILCKSMPFS